MPSVLQMPILLHISKTITKNQSIQTNKLVDVNTPSQMAFGNFSTNFVILHSFNIHASFRMEFVETLFSLSQCNNLHLKETLLCFVPLNP